MHFIDFHFLFSSFFFFSTVFVSKVWLHNFNFHSRQTHSFIVTACSIFFAMKRRREKIKANSFWMWEFSTFPWDFPQKFSLAHFLTVFPAIKWRKIVKFLVSINRQEGRQFKINKMSWSSANYLKQLIFFFCFSNLQR